MDLTGGMKGKTADISVSEEEKKKAKAGQKQKVEIIILAILVPVFVYLLMTTFFKPAKKTVVRPPVLPVAVQPVAANFAPAPKPAEAPKPQTAKPTASEPSQAAKEWGDNPFVARSSKVEQDLSGPLRLQGIVLEGTTKAYAVINEKIVAVGDTLADNTVKEIRRNQVVLVSKDGKETILNA